MAVQNDTALGHVLNGSSKHIALHVASSVGKLLGAHTVVDTNDILLNDGALIKVAGDEVGSGTDNLNTTVVGLVVGLSALERGQEAVVDVDDATGHGGAQSRRQNLHVTSQNDQVDVVFADQLQNLGLLLRLGGCGDGKVVEGDVVGSRKGGEIGVVGHNQGDLNAELAGRLAEQKVVEAVADLGDHDQHAGLLHASVDLEVEVEALGGGLECGVQLLEVGSLNISIGLRKVGAHEKALGGGITILRRVDDVEVILNEEGSDGMDNTGAVGARQGEDEAGHCIGVESVYTLRLQLLRLKEMCVPLAAFGLRR